MTITDPNKTKCPRILIVDDDEDQCQLMCEAMNMYFRSAPSGNVIAVGSGSECLSQPLETFDIILLDHHLPDTTGLDLVSRIVAQVDLPIIMVTGENVSATAVEAIKRGAQDYVVKLGDYLFALPIMVEKNIRQHQMKLDNQRLHSELQVTLNEVRVKNIQLEESLAKVRTMAITDHLTGLSNRHRFGDVLELHYNEAVRYGFDLTCCMCDLDNYKDFNDCMGHQYGDKLLMITADVIRSSLRSSDVAARYGGDEFVLLLPHTSIERAKAVGERIRQQIIVESRSYCNDTPVTISVGIGSLKKDNPPNGDALVAMADRALYTAKACGKDQIVAFNEMGDVFSLRT